MPSRSSATPVERLFPRGTNPRARATILRAANQCFRKHGIRRVSMDDVAEAAGVSRATVYNYFSNKSVLLAEIIVGEARRVNAQANSGLDFSLASGELLVEAELRILECALKSPYADLFTGPDAVKLTADVVGHSERFSEVQREYWRPVFEELRQRGDLNPELKETEALNWLDSITFLLATGPVTFDQDPATRRRYLLHYVAPAFLRSSAAGD